MNPIIISLKKYLQVGKKNKKIEQNIRRYVKKLFYNYFQIKIDSSVHCNPLTNNVYSISLLQDCHLISNFECRAISR